MPAGTHPIRTICISSAPPHSLVTAGCGASASSIHESESRRNGDDLDRRSYRQWSQDDGQHSVNKRGTILIQEDVGGNAHIGKLWRYSIPTGALEIIAQHDPDRFAPGAPNFLTIDEESSGVIAMDDILGDGWWLLDVQLTMPPT
jgi:hypothetical protein